MFCMAPTCHHVLSHSSMLCPPLVPATPCPPCMCLACALIPHLCHAPCCALPMCAAHLHTYQAFSTHFGPSPHIPASTYAPRPFLMHCTSNQCTLVLTHTVWASSMSQPCTPHPSHASCMPFTCPSPSHDLTHMPWPPFDMSCPAPSQHATAAYCQALFWLHPHVFHPCQLSASMWHSPANIYTHLVFSNNNNSISSYPISLCLYFSS